MPGGGESFPGPGELISRVYEVIPRSRWSFRRRARSFAGVARRAKLAAGWVGAPGAYAKMPPTHRAGRTIMPTVLKVGPYRFFFVSLDRGEPPHVHVQRESKVAKFWLDPVALQRSGGYNRVELNTIAALLHEHRDALLESWYEFFGH